jgi:hypothetical protein
LTCASAATRLTGLLAGDRIEATLSALGSEIQELTDLPPGHSLVSEVFHPAGQVLLKGLSDYCDGCEHGSTGGGQAGPFAVAGLLGQLRGGLQGYLVHRPKDSRDRVAGDVEVSGVGCATHSFPDLSAVHPRDDRPERVKYGLVAMVVSLEMMRHLLTMMCYHI